MTFKLYTYRPKQHTHIKGDITFTNESVINRNFTGISRISSHNQLFSVLLKHHMAEYVYEMISYIPNLPMSTNFHHIAFSKIGLNVTVQYVEYIHTHKLYHAIYYNTYFHIHLKRPHYYVESLFVLCACDRLCNIFHTTSHLIHHIVLAHNL